MTDTAFCVRLRAATLQKVIEVRQANGLSATEWIWLRTDMLTLADRVDQGQRRFVTTARR